VRIDAKPGDVVRAGQRLAQLASPDFGQVQSEGRKAAADLALAEKNLARVRELVANDVAAKKDLQNAEAEFARSRAEHARALERVRLYGGGEAVDSTFALRSPIAGTVVERNINPGQELRPESATANMPAMFVVTDPTRLWVLLDATERELPLLRAGRIVTFKSSAYPDDTFDARIDAVSDFIDPQSRTIKVRGSAANEDRRLKGEMYVVARLEVAVRPGVSIPAKAVFLLGNRHFVFIEESPGRFLRVEVHTEGEDGGVIPVIAGVAAGQKVVVDGSLFLQQIFASKAKN
jgi:cobalt-zinc-cadmium efflux system membrane fusion protein